MTVLTPFNPAPEIVDALIDELGSPDCTLRDIANEYKTTLEALTLWLSRDDIAARLNNIESAVCRRTRLIATNFTPCVARLCTIIVSNHFEDEHELDPGPVTNEPRRRSRDGARKAGALLLRLARLFPSTSPPRSKPDASMPHASMPSSSSPSAPGTAALRADPSIPSSPSSPASSDLPNLVARASAPCPSPSSASPSPSMAVSVSPQPISGFASLIPGVRAGSTPLHPLTPPACAAITPILAANSHRIADIFSGSSFAQPPKPG